MSKLLSIAVATAFAASSFAVVAQDKKQEVKSQGTNVTTPGKAPVTTGTDKPKQDKKGAAVPAPEHQGKRKTEAERTDKKK